LTKTDTSPSLSIRYRAKRYPSSGKKNKLRMIYIFESPKLPQNEKEVLEYVRNLRWKM